jgi:IMP dehydrogenase/GMP reductase
MLNIIEESIEKIAKKEKSHKLRNALIAGGGLAALGGGYVLHKNLFKSGLPKSKPKVKSNVSVRNMSTPEQDRRTLEIHKEEVKHKPKVLPVGADTILHPYNKGNWVHSDQEVSKMINEATLKRKIHADTLKHEEDFIKNMDKHNPGLRKQVLDILGNK